MRINDKALAELSNNLPVIEGRLHHKKINSGNFSQAGFRERWFKLVSNMLFYFNMSETGALDKKKPVGAFILENSLVQYEGSLESPFAFSVTFKDEVDKKHIFSGRSEEYVNRWITAMKEATYEYWRAQLLRLQYKICKATGEDPLLMIPRNNITLMHTLSRDDSSENPPTSVPVPSVNTGSRNSSFQSYLSDPTSTNQAQVNDITSSYLKKNETKQTFTNFLTFNDNHFGNSSLQRVGSEVNRSEFVKLPPPPGPVKPPRSPKKSHDKPNNPVVENLIEF